jgi:hypothetical protein
MKYAFVFLSVIFFINPGLSPACAQESVSAASGEVTGSGGNISYSIGQVFFHTFSGNSLSITEGVQQPYEISVVTGIFEAKEIKLSANVYPNPTIDQLTLQIKDIEISNLSFRIYDINGRLLLSEKINGNETIIYMSDYMSSIYFIKVYQGNSELKIFKIVKQ